MARFIVGAHSETQRQVHVDLDVLLRSRLLVQANSGGGKSWILRRILEQTHGKMQQIVLDYEGEFSTLREKYDYILVGKGGDVQADVRSAPLLAERLLELGVSAIIDLYELKKPVRISFVKAFLEAMVNIRKELWHPVLVVIDEAHIYCPEKGDSEAREAVIDLCSRGRKRAFCALLATQRLSKLSKDAAAECNNKMIGRAGLDVDMKRSAEELGFTSREQLLSLRALQPGEFYVFGPAIGVDVQKVKVGEVITTHPEPGMKGQVVIPPPAEKVMKVLAQLSDLPKQAEEKQRSLEFYQKQARDLAAELHRLKLEKTVFTPVDEKNIRTDERLRIEGQLKRPLEKALNDHYAQVQKVVRERLQGIIELAGAPLGQEPVDTSFLKILIPSAAGQPTVAPYSQPAPIRRNTQGTGTSRSFRPIKTPAEGALKVKAGARRLIAALVAWSPNGMTEGQMRAHAGLRKSGTYGQYKSAIINAGLVEEKGGMWYATQEGIDFMGNHAETAPSTTEEVMDVWMPKLKAGARRMLEVLVGYQGESIPEDRLREEAGLSNSGTYGQYKGSLRTARLIVTDRGGMIAADKETLFL